MSEPLASFSLSFRSLSLCSQPGGKKIVGLESAILEIHRFFKTTFIQQSEKKTVTMLQVMPFRCFSETKNFLHTRRI